MLKNIVKYKAAKKVLGDGPASTIVAVNAVKRSNARADNRRSAARSNQK